MFKELHIHTHTHTYIYIYVSIGFRVSDFGFQGLGAWGLRCRVHMLTV